MNSYRASLNSVIKKVCYRLGGFICMVCVQKEDTFFGMLESEQHVSLEDLVQYASMGETIDEVRQSIHSASR